MGTGDTTKSSMTLLLIIINLPIMKKKRRTLYSTNVQVQSETFSETCKQFWRDAFPNSYGWLNPSLRGTSPL